MFDLALHHSCLPACFQFPVRLFLTVLTVAAVPMQVWGGQSELISLAPLDGLGSSEPSGVSADGSAVVGTFFDTTAGSWRGFRWTQATGRQNIGGLNGGLLSQATGISGDGSTVVGWAIDGPTSNAVRAFRWTQANGMQSLGTFNGGTMSRANGVSADGSVVVGYADNTLPGYQVGQAFRWTRAAGMQNLGGLNGGFWSEARAASSDGSVVVGWAQDPSAHLDTRAFRWTQAAGMQSLGVLNGGSHSDAYGISADGSVIVGWSDYGATSLRQAFRWTPTQGMENLGVLNGGLTSQAYAVSANGQVVVGRADDGQSSRAFRWTRVGGMQTVENWLRGAGVSIPADMTMNASAVNNDGSVVVGWDVNNHTFIARVSPAGSGLVTLSEVSQSLDATSRAGSIGLRSANLVIKGAHTRPLARLVTPGQNTFWIAGDLGRDDHGNRQGHMGIGEVGGGYHFGYMQLNLALGQTWASQNIAANGYIKNDGNYVMAQALVPLGAGNNGGIWAIVETYQHWGEANIRRGYLNAGTSDASMGSPGTTTWMTLARLEWENAAILSQTSLSPYADLSYSLARLNAYTETGGSFPARFDSRKEHNTEFRLGVDGSRPLASANTRIVGTLEAVHSFELRGARTSGEIIGLFAFDLQGEARRRDWIRVGAGIESRIGNGLASFTLNMTTKGEMPNIWVATAYQMAF